MNNLKEIYNVVCALLAKITNQKFSIQDVDDRNNIAKFNIICNDDWQVLYPKLQEEFAGNGRVLIRPSGTEPLVRVMIEGENQKEITEKAEKIANLIEKKFK